MQNEQLKHELLLENKFSIRPGDANAQALINRLQDEGDMLARQVRARRMQAGACRGMARQHILGPESGCRRGECSGRDADSGLQRDG